MDVLKGEVGRHQQLVSRRNAQHGAVIAYATDYASDCASDYVCDCAGNRRCPSLSQMADPENQLLLAKGHTDQYTPLAMPRAPGTGQPARGKGSRAAVTMVIWPDGHANYAALVTVQRVVVRLTREIRFATVNSPFTDICRTKCCNLY